MDDLVQWLRAQLDEDAARAAQWHNLECEIHTHLDRGLLAAVAASQMLQDVPGAVCDCGGPARVLREIDAKRQLLADALAETHFVNADDGYFTCAAATEERDGGSSDQRVEPGACDCGRDERVTRQLRLLAWPYAGRPGFKAEEWAP